MATHISRSDPDLLVSDPDLLAFWHQDHLGSSSVITDGTGGLVQRLTYYPYGETRTNESSATPTVDVPYKYTDQELDSSTELYYYGARYYDPALGRFLSPDTIVPDPQQPQDLNRYTYARNNPFGYTDPTGHEGEPAGGGWGWGWSWGDWYINPMFGPPILPPATMTPGLLLPLGDLGAQLQASALNPFGEVQRLGLGLDKLLEEPPLMLLSSELAIPAAVTPPVGGSGTWIADLASLNPVIGLARDIAGLILGHDPNSREPVSPLNFAIGAGTIATGGGAPGSIGASILNVLKPGGKAIGQAGSEGVRVLEGGRDAIESLFLQAAQHGKLVNHPTYNGLFVDLGQGASISFRESRRFGPTIDVNIPGVEFTKIHIK